MSEPPALPSPPAVAQRRKATARFCDIAEAAGVGVATVNRVLNDHPGVSAKTRSKVLQAAKGLGVSRILPESKRGIVRFDVALTKSDSPFYKRLHHAITQYAQLIGPRVVVHRYAFDRESPAGLIAFLQTPPHPRNGLIVAAPDTADIQKAVQQVVAQGVPVVTLMSDISQTQRLHYTGIDNYAAGRSAGFFMGKMIAQAGVVLVLTNDLKFRAHRDRTGGLLAVINERYPHLSCLPIQAGYDDPKRMEQLMFNAIRLHGAQLVGVYHSGAGSAGIAKALQRLPLSPPPLWIGHEMSDEHRIWIEQGLMAMVIDQDPDGQVLSAMQHLMHANELTEQPPPSNPTDFRLFYAEKLPPAPYLPMEV